MVRLNVYFLRHGLAKSEGDDLEDLPNMCQLMNPTKKKLDNLTKKVDPPLTEKGYKQAEDSLRALASAFHETGEQRRFGLITEPFKRCVASALMVSVAGFEPRSWSCWTQLTNPKTAEAPTAIPIVVENAFVDACPTVRKMGGYKVVVDGGLIHCAALFWNKAYRKDPIMGIVREMKDVVQERIKKWVHAQEPSDDILDYRLATDVQYLRYEEEGDPYSLTPMSLKFNLTTDLLAPNKILDPHRSGMYHSKLPPTPPSAAMDALDDAVETARRSGVDTLIMVVTPEFIEELMQRIGKDVGVGEIGPGTILSTVAKTKKGGDISWKLHHVSKCGKFTVDSLAPFSGMIEPSKEPPEEFTAAMKEAGEEKWGSFPRPVKENVPPRYPKIPAFSKALSLPEPTEKWAWVHEL